MIKRNRIRKESNILIISPMTKRSRVIDSRDLRNVSVDGLEDISLFQTTSNNNDGLLEIGLFENLSNFYNIKYHYCYFTKNNVLVINHSYQKW